MTTVTIQGLDRLRAKFAEFPKVAPKYIAQALASSGKALVTASQRATLATLPQRTGKLRSAFKWRTKKTSGEFYVDQSIAPYAVFVHEGTKPHEIVAKNARTLAFPWNKAGYVKAASGRSYYRSGHVHQSSGGMSLSRGRAGSHPGQDMVFLRRVHHPGTKPHPFMQTIAAQATPEIVQAFTQAYSDMIAQT